MSDNNIMSMQGQLVGMPLAGPESFSNEQLAYLKRALGIDETVLWEGTRTGSVTLSESAYNFEFIRIEFDENASNAPNPILTIKPSAVMTTGWCFGAGNAWLGIIYMTLTGNTGLSIIGSKGLNFGSFTSTTVNISANVSSDQLSNSICKVVGIHRIAGGN